MIKERDLQTTVFEFLAWTLPADCVCFAVPNGDGRVTRMPGTLAGVPDICLIYRGRPIFIEMKSVKGAVRPSQRFVHDRLTLAGAVVAVCRSVDEVRDFLASLMPLKGRVT